MKFQRLIASALCSIVLATTACSKYQTQYEGPYSDEGGSSNTNNNYVYEVICVQGGELFSMDRHFRVSKKLPTTGGAIEQASINYSHDKIAYKTSSGSIQIMDSAGVFIATVPNSTDVEWFDWHANNETLYMLTYTDQIKLYGPNISLASTNAQNSLPYFAVADINSIAVTPDGSVLISHAIPGSLIEANGVYVANDADNDFFCFKYLYNMPTKVRINENGTKGVYSLTDNSGFNPKAHSFPVAENGFVTEIENSPQAAISPDGSLFIKVSDSRQSLYSGVSFASISPGSGNITDLDW
jgi:hypothetical protein